MTPSNVWHGFVDEFNLLAPLIPGAGANGFLETHPGELK